MAWSASKIFRPALADVWANTTALDLDGTDTLKAAIYDDGITPNQDVTSANSAYGAGVWTTTGGQTGTNQVYHTGQWAQGGVALTSPVVNSGTAGVVFFDATDTASGSAATMSNMYGCLVYDDSLTSPVADQGICFTYFGGANQVTAGTATIIWHANGIWRFTI